MGRVKDDSSRVVEQAMLRFEMIQGPFVLARHSSSTWKQSPQQSCKNSTSNKQQAEQATRMSVISKKNMRQSSSLLDK